MKITSKEIFEEYTQAEGKTNYIKKKAKVLQVPESTIVCELLKTGYKFEELNRSNTVMYNAAVNKFTKWKESGSPFTEYEVPEVLPVTEKKPYRKPELIEAPSKHFTEEDEAPVETITAAEAAKLTRIIQEQSQHIEELTKELETLRRNYSDEYKARVTAEKKLVIAERFILNNFLYAQADMEEQNERL